VYADKFEVIEGVFFISLGMLTLSFRSGLGIFAVDRDMFNIRALYVIIYEVCKSGHCSFRNS
jgi:hypothetical protein